MVLPAKIFEIKGDVDLGRIAEALRGFREVESYEDDEGGAQNLVTEVLDLKREEDVVAGFFSRDFVRGRYYRRQFVETLTTEEAPFWIRPFRGRTFLIVMAPSVARGVKKLLTNHVANKLSEVVYNATGAIVEVRIPHETLRELHESNPRATKLIWFDDVDIPSVEKLCLAGDGLADTKLYHDYLDHGMIWYVVFEVQKRGITVGITRNCVVTLFSKSTMDEFIGYILEDLLSLVE
ncbi:hypothetical protein AC482_06200 [miscellaneous Crenarchaeota group-15 archaeon DG-45]|uniref:Uncharacterized protein n=1 Tax=miscellaneous Crenarchaeota group-15 archaeon DG-45 TaxID=1685127 RepID=A0A0M0BLT1_9ARCH|nr:MAG: hypothetical protein AC482_06200 [miscellaneous Crenarchaeota group-15 archaeon DG-45]